MILLDNINVNFCFQRLKKAEELKKIDINKFDKYLFEYLQLKVNTIDPQEIDPEERIFWYIVGLIVHDLSKDESNLKISNDDMLLFIEKLHSDYPIDYKLKLLITFVAEIKSRE